MDQMTYLVGNPTSLLIERIFWLSLGGFLGLSIITSMIRGLNENKDNTKLTSSKELENLAKKTIQQNRDIN
tara:strand:+ start:237 stop:449 length:213 start_codon:yes stop_codon:yes gene_type:complete